MQIHLKAVIGLTSLLWVWSSNQSAAAPIPITFGSNAYEFIVAPGISHADATVAAQAMTFMGTTGHLVTILSAAENAFVLSLLTGVDQSVWIGASDVAVEGQWRWVTGEQFWQGNASGTAGPDVLYANWAAGQPDNFGVGQNVATMFGPNVPAPFVPGTWDDGGFGGGGTDVFGRDGYVVEFDAVVPEPSSLAFLLVAIASVTIYRKTKRISRSVREKIA